MFRGCGASHNGPIECRDWNPIVERYNLTGTFTRILDPKMEKVNVVVHNKDPDKIIQNSINIRLESQYSGFAVIIFIIGLVIFYMGLATEKKITRSKRVNLIKSRFNNKQNFQ